tara:strand:- start:374 stop:499 length:126 start_codon:yes stop_codon:yes gene_type:complete
MCISLIFYIYNIYTFFEAFKKRFSEELYLGRMVVSERWRVE